MKTDVPSEIIFHDESIPHYDDNTWDIIEPARREAFALSQAINAAIFAKRHVPFYRSHLAGFSENNIQDIHTLEEFACVIPQTTKPRFRTFRTE